MEPLRKEGNLSDYITRVNEVRNSGLVFLRPPWPSYFMASICLSIDYILSIHKGSLHFLLLT